MARVVTQHCSCTDEYFGGMSRPEKCPCGNRFLTVAQKAALEKPRAPLRRVSLKREAEEEASTRPRSRGSTIRRKEPDRDWKDARAKVDEEGCCRICKRSDRKLEAAHVLGREHDEPKVNKRTGEILKVLYVHPDRVLPACGAAPDGTAGCHEDVDAHRINYLQHLTLPEQLQAVKDAGGIEAARIRLAPVDHRQEVEENSAAVVAENGRLRARNLELEAAGMAA
ncbi:MAG TPA: hypothetical protein VMS11_01810 [Solirubrobacterales bacterium]|nr:hypothetical protein [Solirubrobacterales bacterium]